MPSYGPEVIGPPPRDTAQKYWDPDIQTMDPERLRALQNERLGTLLRKIFDNPVPLFKDKLIAAGIGAPEDVKTVDDLRHVPLTVKQDLRDSETAHPPFGQYRFTDPRAAVRIGTSTGTTGTPTISLWTRRRSVDRVRVLGPHVVALRVSAGDDRDPRPSRLPLRRRPHAVGLLRVLRDAQHLGPSARHRRARRAGPALLDTGEARHPLHGVLDGPLLRGRRQGGHRPQGRRARVQGHARLRHGQGHAAHDGRGRVLRVRGRRVRPAARCPHQRGLGASSRPSTPPPARRCPTGSGATWSSPRSTATTACCATTSRRRAPSCASRARAARRRIRGLWGGRFKDLIAVQGTRFQANEVESALRGVPDVTEPTLEWQMVRPADEARPLVVRVERGSGATADDAELAAALRGGGARAPRHRRRHRGARPRDHPPFGLQGGPGGRRMTSTATGSDPLHDLTLADVLRAHVGTRPTSTGAVCGEHRLDLRSARPPGEPARQRARRRRRGRRRPAAVAGPELPPAPRVRSWRPAKIGAVFCPANWRQSAEEFAFVHRRLRSRRGLLPGGRDRRHAAPSAREESGSKALWLRHDVEGDGGYEAFLAGGADARPRRGRPTTRRRCS